MNYLKDVHGRDIKKERPILFSAPMVQAILDGRKTQTRRVVKVDQNKYVEDGVWKSGDEYMAHLFMDYSAWHQAKIKCPYGIKGDYLWVRETFWKEGHYVRYRADGRHTSEYARWKPSIHMPRVASRIDLLIKDVRVERLHDISEEDSKAEGTPENLTYVPVQVSQEAMEALKEGGHTAFLDRMANPPVMQDWRQGFFRLWENINGKQSLDSNPFVWVIEFERKKT